MISINSPDDIALLLAQRFRAKRLQLGWSREELAQRAGETVASIKRFELTGEIALSRLLQLCFVLGSLDTFSQVLESPPPFTIADVKRQIPTRQRGRRRKT